MEDKSMTKTIDYASLYGVKSGETDFLGAIRRSLKKGPIHLEKFVKSIKINKQKHNTENYE